MYRCTTVHINLVCLYLRCIPLWNTRLKFLFRLDTPHVRNFEWRIISFNLEMFHCSMQRDLMARRLARRAEEWEVPGSSPTRLTFQSCSRYQLNQLVSKAASDSTSKKSNTCGVSYTRLNFTFRNSCSAEFRMWISLWLIDVNYPTTICLFNKFLCSRIRIGKCSKESWPVVCRFKWHATVARL